MTDILLSRYQILRELGSGGFGDTYLAEDLALPGHPLCVVKHLKPKDTQASAIAVAKTFFEREAQYLYKLGKYDGIPSLYAHFEQNGEFYLVQEFIEGKELSEELIPGKPWSEGETVRLLQEILEVLAIVHRENVIHRDIKPSNIMRRTRDRKLVLIDFGAVKEIGALGVTTAGQSMMTIGIGTPGYMPSEQAQGKPRFASDVYAVGRIGIQALTGLEPERLPEDPNTGRILWRDRVRVSDRLADILDRMVHEYYRSRYQNASEALEALTSQTNLPRPLSEVQTWVAPTSNPTSALTPEPERSGLSKLLKTFLFVALGGLTVGAIAGVVVLNRLFTSPSSPPVVFDTPAPTETPESTAPLETPSPTPIPTQEPTPEATVSPTPTETPETPTPSPTPTAEPTPTPTPTPESNQPTLATVTNPPVFVRDRPSLAGSVLCPIRTSTTIEISQTDNGWYQTDVCGKTGYIHQSQLTFESSNH
jgi:eukaryotic-like serine/threonine-protein kinase